MSLQIETAQNVGIDYEIASIGDRILAQFLDYLVYIGWFIAIFSFVALLQPTESKLSTALFAVGVLPIMLYPVLTEYFLNGQTVGKMALKIRVIKLDGSKPSLSSYLLRWLLSIVDISLFSGLVAIFTIAITGKGQRLGDLAAGTAVIKTKTAVQLGNLVHPAWAHDYKPSFPGVTQLSDKDISILRKVIASASERLQQEAVHRIEDLLGVNSMDEPKDFLIRIVNDYEYYATIKAD